MNLDANFFTALGSDLAGIGAISCTIITFVFYRELTGIERARSKREMAEANRQKREKAAFADKQAFEKDVRDFVAELHGRISDHYPIHDVMLDLGQGDLSRMTVAIEALDRVLKRREKIPSERNSIREIIFSHLDSAEPRKWPGWELRIS